MKRTGFKRKTYAEALEKKKAKAVKKVTRKEKTPAEIRTAFSNKLWELVTGYIKKRDSIDGYDKKGYCCCCKKLCEGKMAQGGHYKAKASCGAILRYHPHNIHLQCGGCNMKYNQEEAKTLYAIFMLERYGKDKLRQFELLKQRMIKEDMIHLKKLYELYEKGVEKDIIDYLEGL